MSTRKIFVRGLILMLGVFFLSTQIVLAQPCEGNFDCDDNVDGTDAYIFKENFGRNTYENPCDECFACPSCEPVCEPCATCSFASYEELEARVAYLETLLVNVTRVMVGGQDTIRFSGVNVQIVDGSGGTAGTVNSLGNLIVGYNETRNDGTDDRTGSHNIVVGSRHNYSSYGGLVAGYQNNVLGIYATVSGGQNNTASGDQASVSGGARNTASGWHANVAGGRYNEASGDFSFVGGGGYTTAVDGNKAFGHYSAVLGGRSNLTGDPDLIDHTFAQSASVSGGYQNTASGSRSSVSGGFLNTATAWGASVCGGYSNDAIADYSSVSGGIYNTASGGASSVSGGDLNEASGISSSVSGGYSNEASGGSSSVSGGLEVSVTDNYDWRSGDCYFCDE